METIGTRPEENNSYQTVITLIVSGTVGIVLSSLLEMAFYFLYSMKVWRFLILLRYFILFNFLYFQFHPVNLIVQEPEIIMETEGTSVIIFLK